MFRPQRSPRRHTIGGQYPGHQRIHFGAGIFAGIAAHHPGQWRTGDARAGLVADIDIGADAEAKAQRIREGADAYAVQVLADLDGRLSTALGSVKKGIESLTQTRIAQSAPLPVAQPLADAAAKSKRAAFDAQSEPAIGETAQLESV